MKNQSEDKQVIFKKQENLKFIVERLLQWLFVNNHL